MSSRARRLAVSSSAGVAAPVASWLEAVADGDVAASGRRAAQRVAPGAATAMPVLGGAASTSVAVTPAQIEQEIFAKGFAQGQQAAAAAAQQETAALAKRLAATLDDLMRVRNEMIRHTEKQMVQLALAVARRVVHREVSLDPNVLVTMMRVALERVSDSARVTWTDFWDALQRNGAFPSAGFTLLIIGATFRWFEQVCQFLRRTGWGIDPFATTRDYIARHRAIGDERTARQAEERRVRRTSSTARLPALLSPCP